ncbi:hypothetical protein PVL29_015455 [Vitis rotundifolia]|uniref:Uncharacterized protein n=1 Tax=Vitis rotundifolia TaxID=103349 RepID=A0AA39DIY2_VITRO|nr:hypothetical protein PVL29_015455 [Vitis rotundifolia]
MEDKSGRMLAFCLATLLVFSTFINVGNASGRDIGYKSLGVDEPDLCGPLHPDKCEPKPSHAYTRGCEVEERCRP